MQRELDERTAFEAMRIFLERYWERGGRAPVDLAVLLSDISTEIWADGTPADPAQWGDWLEAVEEASK